MLSRFIRALGKHKFQLGRRRTRPKVQFGIYVERKGPLSQLRNRLTPTTKKEEKKYDKKAELKKQG